MSGLLPMVLVWGMGCGPSAPVVEDPLPSDGWPEPLFTPGPRLSPPSAFGSVALREVSNGLSTPTVRFTGVFASAPLPGHHPAECIFGGRFCVGFVPGLDGWTSPSAARLDTAALLLDHVGPQLSLGSHEVDIWGTSPEHWFYFEAGDPGAVAEGERLGLSFDGGEWELATGGLGITPPDPIVVYDPAHPRAEVRPGGELNLDWIPSGAGSVELTLWSGAEQLDLPGAVELRRLYLLEDDGHFAIDVDGLGLNNANRNLRALLVARDTVTGRSGNGEIVLTATREHELFMTHRPVIGRTEVLLADDCIDALAYPLAGGEIFADLEGFGNTVEHMELTGALARDGFASIVLSPGERLICEASYPHDDVLVSLWTTCDSAPLSHTNIDRDEIFTYTNDGLTPQTLILQLDSSSFLPPPTLLAEVTVDTPGPGLETGSCLDPPLPPGRHEIALGVAVECSEVDDRPRFRTPVEIPPRGRLYAVGQGAVGLSFEDDPCSAACPDPQPLGYAPLDVRNPSTIHPLVGQVIATEGAPTHGPVPLDLRILGPAPAGASPECGPQTPRLGAGTHWLHGSLGGFTDSAEERCGSASVATGEDAFLQVDLDVGESLLAELETDGFIGMLYLRSSCVTDALLCTDGIVSGSPRMLHYTNHTGAPETVTVVVDTDRSALVSTPGGPYTLFLDVR